MRIVVCVNKYYDLLGSGILRYLMKVLFLFKALMRENNLSIYCNIDAEWLHTSCLWC